MCVHVCTHRHTHTHMPQVLLGFSFVNNFTSLVAAVSLLCDLFPITSLSRHSLSAVAPCSTKHTATSNVLQIEIASRSSSPSAPYSNWAIARSELSILSVCYEGCDTRFPFSKKDFFL